MVASEDCNRPFRLTQRCTQLNLPGLRLFVYCICIIMRHSHSNDREIPETKRFIPKGSELGITLSYPNWSVGHFRVPPDLCIKTRLSAQPYDMEMIFHSHANKTHFIQKGCALGLILKVRVFETRRWPIKFTKSSRPTPRRDVRFV